MKGKGKPEKPERNNNMGATFYLIKINPKALSSWLYLARNAVIPK